MAVPVDKIVGAAVAGVANTVKGVWGLVQRNKAQSQINRLNESRPVYENQSIKDMMALYQQNANISQLPGQQNMESRMNANTASSISQAAQYAPSSAAMLGAITNVYGKKQEAIRDLATTFAQYKAQRQQELAGAYQVAAQDEAQAWNINKWVPWQTKMNEAVSMRQAGMDALWGGMEGIAASGFALAGSSYQGSSMGNGGQQTLSSNGGGGSGISGGAGVGSLISSFSSMGNNSSAAGSAAGSAGSSAGSAASGASTSSGSPGH